MVKKYQALFLLSSITRPNMMPHIFESRLLQYSPLPVLNSRSTKIIFRSHSFADREHLPGGQLYTLFVEYFTPGSRSPFL
ncbi:hypothetical protein SAMN04487894_10838 [Niabella drilacis]|uniref:Uncharacterized protein n=1 Tax=Niabella drilacis (strain DSM 25811 / CCM 8410 / CCUG 62505 / LMG 26954 / E90) TaxID=1285928 RepID=A0A1G6TWL4_NIADE|nr:hypothetical protein SAMN04487894_10838 [Niabella drilacis]